jgi:hypothetical protein
MGRPDNRGDQIILANVYRNERLMNLPKGSNNRDFFVATEKSKLKATSRGRHTSFYLKRWLVCEGSL